MFKKLKYRYRVPVIAFFLRAFARLPLRVCHVIGWCLGVLINQFSKELRSITDINLRLCFPSMTEQNRAKIRRASLIEMGKTLCETPLLWRQSADETKRVVKKIDGIALIENALARNKGLILLSPHLGCWEIISLYVAQHYPMTNMFRPPKISELSATMLDGRQGSGATLVPADATGVRKLLGALRKNEVIGILPDQEPGRGAGDFAPFFGISTHTMTLCARLAHKTDAEVLVCYAERLPKGRGFYIKIFPTEADIKSDDEIKSLIAMNRAIEQLIRACPEQYQWSYRRFRVRPESEPPIYP